MSDIRIVGKSGKSMRKSRAVKLAPMARAVRSALAASAMTFVLGVSGGAMAAVPHATITQAQPAGRTAIDFAPVFDLTVVAAGPVALAIDVTDPGDIVIDNADPITEIDPTGATAIRGYSDDGHVDIVNAATGILQAGALYGDAIGIYGYSATGDVSIDNAADITAVSAYGLADGIFASGANVDVGNSGAIIAAGYSWAAGIEAQGASSAAIENSGDVYAAAMGPGGKAFGLYGTSGGDLAIDNSGSLEAQGYYATGIEASASGDLAVNNSGSITAGYATAGGSFYSALATGINATSNGEGAAVVVSSTGDIAATGFYGASGIAATASGQGGTVSIHNGGDVQVLQGNKYGYGAYGIVASGDGDAMVDNGGAVIAYSAGLATGVAALSFAGDASVVNSGTIESISTAMADYGATGILAFGANGTATVQNSGSVSALSAGLQNAQARAVDAQALGDVMVANSGSLYANGEKYAFGVYASSGVGDLTVGNAADGDIGFYSYAGRGWGVFGVATQGDVAIDNAGSISGYAYGQSAGVFALASQGNASVANSGLIDVASYSGTAVGVFARADYGVATGQNDSSLDAKSEYGTAFGILVRGDHAEAGNSGDINASGFYAATGIAASSYYGTSVSNAGGSIFATATGEGTGIDAQSLYGDVTVDSASRIVAVGMVLGARGIQALSGEADVEVVNSGEIYAGSMYGDAIGIYGYSVSGDVAIDNAGDITAVSYYGLADGIFASGANVDVGNSGAIIAAGYSWAAGIEAQGAGAAVVQNSGDVYAVAIGPGGRAFGLYGTGGDSLTIDNSGGLEAQGYYATGIEATAFGDIAVDSSGSIIAGYANADGDFYSALATGINANSNGEGAAVEISNGGDIVATGFYGANGISATSSGQGGTVNVGNDGNIEVLQGTKYGYGAYGIFASGDGDTSIANDGTVSAYSAGAATGVAALSFAGDAHVVNGGDIEATSTATAYYGATGILAFGANGSASVQNSGSVSASAAGILYSEARAVDAQALGDVAVINGGSLYANGEKYAFGVYASSGSGDLAISNTASGEIGFYSYGGRGWGVFGVATQGDVAIGNAGDISGYAYGQSAGVFAVANQGDAKVSSSGDITVASGSDVAVGAFARADNGTASVTNSGDIEATSAYAAYGVMVRGKNAVVTNSGSISAEGYLASVGVFASGSTSTTVNNSGSIHASAGGLNVGVLFADVAGNVLNNTGAGVISASGDEGYAFAVAGGSAGDTINNGARILGAVSMYGGADVFNNKAGGVWDIGSSISTDFGDGDDAINNLAGGTIRLAGGALSLGGGVAGNTFTNAGTIRVLGDGNLIDMGMAGAAANPPPLMNNGVIDFVDGSTDDVLYIGGHLGGTGAINLDLDLANLASDQLYVGGNMAAGAAQTVNVRITEMPTTASTVAVEFAHVAGTSAAGAFVGGEVLGYAESNFLDIGARTSRLAGAGGSASFLVALDVLGMNDTGALAATTATAAASFLNSQVGTFRQRLGANPYGDADKVMNAFVRFYSSEGDLNPAHHAGNFGQAGSFGFAQTNWGREVGVNANLPGNLHAGIVLGSADSRQRLNDGVGESRMEGSTVGAYATWYAPGGFYIDLSGRWMASDIRSTTAAGVMPGRVHAQATSLEAGYEWAFGSFNLVPQAQYTRTKVDGLDALYGEMASFQSHGGTFEQGRLGVEFNRSFDAAGMRWTPYGSISAIREFDGKTSYTVADNFFGSTSTEGTSTMAELGLGVQKGRFGFGLGLNWTDGGAYKSMIGGQANARFSW
ncbi:autotransporter outer membrane beta-barrel domain-containing protein [Thermomonas fusca]|uniref:autotransporter outer membrane beta-barrel domain-containing protein n=1 Tax=Thermomonas fusca TaxID=215690 RepID=UPI00041EAD7F|nr:autotransporter outer membrane beta-barrel domain-containing protein [Thermomonas fusca]